MLCSVPAEMAEVHRLMAQVPNRHKPLLGCWTTVGTAGKQV